MIQDPESPESTEEVTHSPLGKSSSYKGGPSIGQSSILSSSFIWLEAVFLHFFSLCVCVCVYLHADFSGKDYIEFCYLDII